MKQCVSRTKLRKSFSYLGLGAILLTSVLISGCWLISPSPAKDPSEKIAIPEPATTANDALEIFWRIPDVEIDGFVLSYGTTQDKLTNRVRIEKAELSVVSDEVWGPVFRYLLKDVPKDQTIFFTLESFKGDQYSAPSVVQRVEGK
jgi:hypothetical protein